MSIILIRDGVAARVPLAEFALEETMQTQIAANPGILPLHEIREGLELVAVVRELSVSSGYIDLLGFDAEGEVYVIETKLARNPDRRTVVAQALDYGAALWAGFSDPAAFFSTIDLLLGRAGAPRLADALKVVHEGDETAVGRVLERIGQNIRSGSFRFVIPMDRIGEGLKDLVRYVNENSRFTIYLVELELYPAGDVTVVVPRLFGAESRKTVSSGSAGGRGSASDAAAFEEDIERRLTSGELDEASAGALRDMLRIITELSTRQSWLSGAGGRINVSPRFSETGAAKSPFTLRSDGKLMLNLGYVAESPAWRTWSREILTLVGRSDDPRQFPELKPGEWAPFSGDIVRLTNSAARGRP